MRIYAIGDIHGQTDLLRAAHARIAADRRHTGDDASPVVHLGDLVDRGPDGRGTIDLLMAGIARGAPWIVLKGNHDNMFALYMDEPPATDPGLRTDYTWVHPRLGGLTTLASYGIAAPEALSPGDLHREARARVPAEHIAFLTALPLWHRAADALFVHAGIRPGVPLDRQTDTDLMWIRRDFHDDPRDHGPLIVHGHTPVDVPTHYGNRVNLDTGAAYGGPLTAAVIEDGRVFVLEEAGRVELDPPRQ